MHNGQFHTSRSDSIDGEEADDFLGLKELCAAKVPDYKVDPAAHDKFVRALFQQQPEFRMQQLSYVPYLRKMYRKWNEQGPPREWDQSDIAKPSQPVQSRITFHPAQYFLPFGWQPRLGIYEGRNPLHLLPKAQQLKYL